LLVPHNDIYIVISIALVRTAHFVFIFLFIYLFYFAIQPNSLYIGL